MALVESLRRISRLETHRLVTAMLLIDGVFLAVAVTLTGGARSALLFLMFLDVLAVTLLASYRTGIKIAVWNALLLFLGHAAVQSGAINSTRPADDRDTALGAAAFLAVALCAAAFSALNERALRESRLQLAGLVELDGDLGRAASTGEVGATLARHATARLGFDRAVVLTRTAGRWEGTLARQDGHGTTVACDAPAGPDIISAPRNGGPRLARSLDPEDSLAALLPSAANVAILALVADSECLGFVAAEWGAHRPRIPASTVDVLAQACSHAALAIRARTLLEEVERLAAGDPLTGLANRRVLEDTLQREVERSRRAGSPVTLVLLDVDHFKAINDALGHPAGDAVLRGIARALSANTKGFDLAARVGGDEFAVVLPGCTAAEAPRTAERLRTRSATAVPDGDGDVSAGVATLPDDAVDAKGLVAAADTALYAAKRAGRARVCTARSALRR